MSEQPTPRKSRTITPAPIDPRAHQPWLPQTVSIEEATSLRDCYNGTASPDAQRRAMNTILTKICGIGASTFVPGGEDGRRATDFAEGKRAVALEITALIQVRINRGGEQP